MYFQAACLNFKVLNLDIEVPNVAVHDLEALYYMMNGTYHCGRMARFF